MERKYTKQQALAFLTAALTAADAIGGHNIEPSPRRIQKLLRTVTPNRLRRARMTADRTWRIACAQARREHRAKKRHQNYQRCISNNPCLRSW